VPPPQAKRISETLEAFEKKVGMLLEEAELRQRQLNEVLQQHPDFMDIVKEINRLKKEEDALADL
jgi:response regulator of citrate/malate metabolism